MTHPLPIARPAAPVRVPVGDTLIRAEHLSLRYGAREALSEITLGIPRGEITALVGPSGCGKTSFLGCVNRMTDLVPDAVLSGRVTLADEDVHAPDTDVVTLRRRVGMIFQRPTPFPSSIRANMQLPMREHGTRDRGELEDRMEIALRDVGLWAEVSSRLGSSATSLSGGQQQRLCIARALALRPEALLMDEPCSALDPLASAVVEELVLRLRGSYTILLVTHNLAQARRLADSAALFWMRDGSGVLVEHSPIDAFFGAPASDVTACYVSGACG